MAIFTDNYNLKKPEDTDFFDIADMNGNSDIIDTVLADFEKRLSDNASNEAIEAIDKNVAIHRLGIMGEKSGVYKDVNMLKSLADNVNTYEDFYGLYYILDGLIESGEHIGKFLKNISQSGDTSFDTLSTIDNVVSNSQAMDIIISKDKTKKLFYSSKKAMEKASEVSDATTKILADTYFFERLKEDERLMDIVYNSNVMAGKIISNNNFLNYIFGDFDIFMNVIKNHKFFEKLFTSSTFIQRLISKEEYYKYILQNNVLTKYLCENNTACASFFGNTTIVNAVKKNINIIVNALKYENCTKAFKDNNEILELISNSISCLISLTENGDINLDFYKNIQKYYSNMYINIVNRRLFNQIDISYINTDFGKKSNGIAYIMQLGHTANTKNINIYCDFEKTKLLKTIAPQSDTQLMFDVILFGSFYIEHQNVSIPVRLFGYTQF